MMSPALRRLNLTAHVTSSVGWLGAVASFLALSIAALNSEQASFVRGAYLAMELVGRVVIVPMSLVALATGVAQSLGTTWGLVRHYWVLAKLVLTLGATGALLLHQFTAVAGAARRAAAGSLGDRPEIGSVGTQLALDAGLAVVVLVAATALSLYKPWGKIDRTRGARAGAPNGASAAGAKEAPFPLGLKIALSIVALLALAFVASHLAGGGLGQHAR